MLNAAALITLTGAGPPVLTHLSLIWLLPDSANDFLVQTMSRWTVSIPLSLLCPVYFSQFSFSFRFV